MRSVTPAELALLLFLNSGLPNRPATAAELPVLAALQEQWRIELTRFEYGITAQGRRAIWVAAMVQHTMGVAA